MIRSRKWIALALLALGVAGVVWAANEVQDGQSTYGVINSILGGHIVRGDTTQDANSGDGSGNLYVAEAYPDQTFLIKHTNILQATLYHTYSRLTSSVLKQPQA